MKDPRQTRKDFLKNAGMALGAVITSGFASPKGIDIDFNNFPQDQKDFLLEYAGWLKEFNEFVNQQKEEPNSIENNKRLMELSEEANKRKPQLEQFMEDRNFAIYYVGITQKLSNSIYNQES